MKLSHKSPPAASLDTALPKLPWPIPSEGAWIEIASWFHDSLANRNAWKNCYRISIRLGDAGFSRYVALVGYRVAVDQVNQKERPWPLFGIADAEVEITQRGLRASSPPEKLLFIFEKVAEALRRFAENEKQKYERRLAAREDW